MVVACREVPVRVYTGSVAQAELICAAARVAADILGKCGMRSVVTVSVVVSDNFFLRSHGMKWGEFLPGSSRVNVLSAAMHGKISRFRFDETEMAAAEHYTGILVHEFTHAIFQELSKELDLPETAHEYVAYVVQIGSYSEATRRRILVRDPPIPSSNLFVFSHFLRLADPHRFGVAAYAHFDHPDNGCVFLHKVLQRKVHFPPPSE
jgi:hypothetical protein